MGFQSIRFHGFRNLKDGEIDLGAGDVYLIGENGQGKTNLLEALYVLSYGTSFRTRQDRDLIGWNRKEMAISASVNLPNESAGKIAVTVQEGNKAISLHGKPVMDRKELIHRIPSIVFVHDDFLFAGGPPERRRWFMDQTLSLHDPLYVDQLRRYRRLLKERNHLLKTKQRNLLEHYEEQLAFAGLALMAQRETLTGEFGTIFTPLFSEVSGLENEICLTYRPSWGKIRSTGEVMDRLGEKRELDLTMGTTNTGPHRDRFLFYRDGRDFSKNASTGQRRLLSLILRVAQAHFYRKTTGRKPILLIDDVLLELDPLRRRLFRDRLPASEQVFYTFLPGEETGRKGDNSRTFEVRSGEFHER